MCEELAQDPYTVNAFDEARTRTLRVTGRALQPISHLVTQIHYK